MKIQKIFLFILISFSACTSDKEEGPLISDATLYSMLTNVSSFSYYKNDPDTLNTASVSPHGLFVRIRFNPKAVSSMNDSLSGLKNSSFDDESMIVKEVYFQNGGPLERYVVMYKLKNASNASGGWIWSEMKANGEVVVSASKKGDQCTSCHSQGTHSDLVRTFALH